MTFQVVNVVSVQEWDGGDRYHHKFYFTDYEVAKEYKAKVDKSCYLHHTSLIVCDTIEDVKNWKNGELRQRALAKLTPEDRQVLGLKD